MDSSQAWSLKRAQRQYAELLDTVIVTPGDAPATIAETIRLLDRWWTSNAPLFPAGTRETLARLQEQLGCAALREADVEAARVGDASDRPAPDSKGRAPRSPDTGLDTLLRQWQRSAECVLGVRTSSPANPSADPADDDGTAMPPAEPTPGETLTGVRGATLGAALERYRVAVRAYAVWATETSARSVQHVEQRLRDAGPPAPGTRRELFQSWVDCAESQHAAATKTDRYSRCCGEMVNALVALRRCVNHSLGPRYHPRPACTRVPPGTGVTPREVVYREDRLTLYAYRARNRLWHRPRIPVLIVYALVNRPYVLDLAPGRSTIQGLLDAGLDPYLIDWGYPAARDRNLGLDDYINGYLDHCVDAVRRASGAERVNLLGVCQGGTFALCYSALQPGKVANLVTMVTPVDFHTADNQLSRLIRNIEVDALVQALGNVPGEFLNWAFLSLKPYQLTVQKYVDLFDKLGDENALHDFVAMEHWILDSPDQAGTAFSEFVTDFFQQNKLVAGDAVIGNRRVDLGAIRAPVLNVYATEDHLVPPAASRALARHLGDRDYEELAFEGGHIGIYVSGRAQWRIAPAIGAWLRARTHPA